MLNASAAARRAIPSLDRLLKLPAVEDLFQQYGRTLVVDTARTLLAELRGALGADGGGGKGEFDEASFVRDWTAHLERVSQPSLRAVINLSGTILHTNLGRAVMPAAAARAVARAMTHPVNLEFDLDGGSRGERDHHIEQRLMQLTGAEAALVVNNNAAAVYLVLNTLALRREVVVSRGELVEIGGSFRIPDIMARAGVKMVEIGTTNRTHLKDYARAVTPRTAALMKVHTSNYAIHGFTASVAEGELAALARERELPLITDLGSGMLIDLEHYGLPHEPTPREALAGGVDVVTFSGDKLLGGPQAGLIVGRQSLIERIRRNPMKRALRVDKMTLAALDAVLGLYANPDTLSQELPTLRMLTRTCEDIEAQAHRMLPGIAAACAGKAGTALVPCTSQIGSGSLPVDLLPSAGIAVAPPGKRRGSLAGIVASAFRALPVPVIGRVKDGAFVMDMRCLDDEDEFLEQLRYLDLKGLDA